MTPASDKVSSGISGFELLFPAQDVYMIKNGNKRYNLLFFMVHNSLKLMTYFIAANLMKNIRTDSAQLIQKGGFFIQD
ncbi:hypothetical protein JCM30204_46910 [Dysgonomonas termitidis]